MKTKSTLLLVLLATAALTLAPATAQAGNREDKIFAAVGGFIGGVIVGKHIERHREPVYHQPATRVVIVESAPACPPSGYWQETRTRVYVPARHIVRYDDCGRRVVIHKPAHYTYQTDRVWVENHRRGHHHDRHDTWNEGPRYARR